MLTVNAYAAPSATEPLIPTTIERRDVGPKDVLIEIRYAGICHSDIHQARDEWGGSKFPMVPGHEISGLVSATGTSVTKFKKGDRVGGNWVFKNKNGLSSAYRSLHINTSRTRMQYARRTIRKRDDSNFGKRVADCRDGRGFVFTANTR